MLADLPFQLFYSFLFIAIPYYPIGFHPDVERFFIAVALIMLVANVATSFGILILICLIKKKGFDQCHFLNRIFRLMLGIFTQDIFCFISSIDHPADALWWVLPQQWICSYLLPVAPLYLLADVRKQCALY